MEIRPQALSLDTREHKMHERDIEGYRRAQRLGYDCAVSVSTKLEPGITEIEAADLLRQELISRGAKNWFHVPLVWFGERSRFDGMKGYRDYLPSKRKFNKEDVAILDCAPIVDGYIGDIGYTTSLKPNKELTRARKTLLELREKLPSMFSSKESLGSIWRAVERDLRAQDFDNCYKDYPFAVLGHRVSRVRPNSRFWHLPSISYIGWFGPSAAQLFMKQGIFSSLIRSNSAQDKEGFWAIEPHLGGRGFGAKFEEILVVEANEARWLDDDVPHLHCVTNEFNLKPLLPC
jgi:Xaa-Pro aminopeptidase